MQNKAIYFLHDMVGRKYTTSLLCISYPQCYFICKYYEPIFHCILINCEKREILSHNSSSDYLIGFFGWWKFWKRIFLYHLDQNCFSVQTYKKRISNIVEAMFSQNFFPIKTKLATAGFWNNSEKIKELFERLQLQIFD